MIRLNDIVVKFGDFTALHGINVHVKEGEFFTFLGPSGCGKTTTLRTITGFIEPVEGAVVVKDRDITHVPIEDRNIGIVFQSYMLFAWKTVRDNVELGLKLRNVPAAERHNIADHYIKMVGLEGFENHYPHQLSGGMKQRVVIAIALACEPDLLIADEPTSDLDEENTALIMEHFQRQADSGKAVLISTHDLSCLRPNMVHYKMNKGVMQKV